MIDNFQMEKKDQPPVIDKGTGLGLTLTKQFIEMHQGVIWVESEYNKGSCFHILLPAKSYLVDGI